jgi:hypothetical protein
MKIKKVRISTLLLYLTVFIPYIRILPINSDTQPNALIISFMIAFVYITVRNEKIPKEIYPIIFVLLVASSVTLFGGISNNDIRSLTGYISAFLITLATYFVMKNEKSINISLLKKIIVIWGIVGIIQTVYPSFLSSIVARMSTTQNRGVTSLAPEPTFYATIMFFIAISFILFSKKKKEKILWVGICLVQIIFLAKSAMIAFVVGIIIIVAILENLLKKWNVKRLIITILFIGISIFSVIIINNSISDLRIVVSLQQIIDDPMLYFRTDASANDRLSAIVLSFRGSFENYFIPNGFNSWQNYESLAKASSNFFWYGRSTRIMSMYGAIIYEMGIIGLIVPLLLNVWLIRFLKSKHYIGNRWYVIFSINLICFTAIPLATPFIGYLLGALLYFNKKTLQNKKEMVTYE